jgi:hypothetical protein
MGEALKQSCELSSSPIDLKPFVKCSEGSKLPFSQHAAQFKAVFTVFLKS